jgi:flotillin
VEIERRRVADASKAVVEAQKIRQLADAEAYKRKQQSEAKMFEDMKLAEGLLYDKEKEAQGIAEIFKAQSEGLAELLSSFAGDEQAAMDFLMMERQTFQQLAAFNAGAIQGLAPEFCFWETDQEADSAGLISLAKSLPPILSTIKDQTGIKPPSWLAQMADGGKKDGSS